MNTLAPVRALCYSTEALASVTAPPYDDVDKELFQQLTERSAYNVVRIDLPQGSGLARYTLAADRLEKWMSRGVLRYGERDVLLRYAQTFSLPGSAERLVRRSFIALLKIAPYGQGVLPHEKTLDGPREDRFQVFVATRANLSPMFFVYQDPKFVVDGLFDQPLHPVASFSDHAGVEHALSALRDRTAMVQIANFIAKQQLIIADGHHRYEAARRCSEHFTLAGETAAHAAHRYVPAMLVNEYDAGLRIRATHRILRQAFDLDALRERLEPWATFTETSEPPQLAWKKLRERDEFAVMVHKDTTWRLRLHVNADDCAPLADLAGPIRALAVSVLHRLVFGYGLGIDESAQAAGNAIKFKRDVDVALSKLSRPKTSAVFLMPAASMADVRLTSEAGAYMPQKSTAFYPKAPAGLVIHTFEKGREIVPLG